MQIIVIFQLEQFVCFSQSADLAVECFHPRVAVPDSCTERDPLSVSRRVAGVNLFGLLATLYG